MIRMQIQFSEHQLRLLREQAASEQASVSEIVRRAVDRWIDARAQPTTDERRRRAIAAAGRFASGHRDIAERHDDFLPDAFEQ
jgi:Arc/MetJ-type ribon-helix-helix transcriptional regulator